MWCLELVEIYVYFYFANADKGPISSCELHVPFVSFILNSESHKFPCIHVLCFDGTINSYELKLNWIEIEIKVQSVSTGCRSHIVSIIYTCWCPSDEDAGASAGMMLT